MSKHSKAVREEALTSLRESLKPGDTVHLILRSVSRSGMSRTITPLKLEGDGERYLGYSAARACGLNDDGDHGVKMGGCGMDMGFALVYEMSATLFPQGFGCVGERCPSNDHSNGDRDHTPHGEAQVRECPGCGGTGKTARYFGHPKPEMEDCRTCQGRKTLEAGHWHQSGGYALRHRWL